jgi:hypothetical protein
MLARLGVSGMWDFDPQEWEHFTGILSNERHAPATKAGDADPSF